MKRRGAMPREVVEKVRPIIEAVEARGLDAALEYSQILDGIKPEKPLIEPTASRRDNIVDAVEAVAKSLEKLYSRLVPQDVVDVYGGVLRTVLWKPVRKAALYVPARYISTLVMLAVPAKVAGVEEIYVVTPPRGVAEEFLTAAARLGVKGVLQLGGAHGLAYAVFHLGVDVVAGPGGLFVQAAKYVLSQYVGIDGTEGPTELVVYAEGVSAEAATRGALAQLEHGPTSFVYFLSPDGSLLSKAKKIYEEEKTSSMGPLEVKKVVDYLEAARIIDEIAPEHLEVWGRRELAYMVKNVGAVSVDMPSPYLDYAAGISHVLPTGGSARWRGIVTPHTFLKPIGVVESLGVAQLLEAAKTLAEYEGFTKHLEALNSMAARRHV